MPAGAAAKLIVDAPAFVALCADMQAAEVSCLQDQLAFCVGLGFDLGVHRLPFVSRHGGGIHTPLTEPSRVRNSALPPNRISVPRPAMLVAMVTA